MNKSKIYKKTGFTLAEALIFLLISTLMMLAAMPVISTRHLIPAERTPHGKWACKRDASGNLISATAAHVDAELPTDDSQWSSGCTFPKLPSSIKYINVIAIGAGADGGRSKIEPVLATEEQVMFPDFESHPFGGHNQSEIYKIEEDGVYNIYFQGAKGQDGELRPIFITNVINGALIDEVYFDDASASAQVPTISFSYPLEHGDALMIKQDCSDEENKRNGQDNFYCRTVTVPKGEKIRYSGTTYTLGDDYKIEEPTHFAGPNGCKRTLFLMKNSNSIKLATIWGSGGGYYYSASDILSDDITETSCIRKDSDGVYNVDIRGRYSTTIDRFSWTLQDYFKETPLSETSEYNLFKGNDAYPAVENYTMAMNTYGNSTIQRVRHNIKFQGGCGGAAGAVVNTLIPAPKEIDSDLFYIGNALKKRNDKGERNTTFRVGTDYIVANGADKNQCFGNGPSNNENGVDGESVKIKDKEYPGGKGREGRKDKTIFQKSLLSDIYGYINYKEMDYINRQFPRGCVKNTPYKPFLPVSDKVETKPHPNAWCLGKYHDLQGNDAKNMGTGGGGGGAVLGLPGIKTAKEEIDEFVASEYFINFDDIVFTADGGKGASGGIIVSW